MTAREIVLASCEAVLGFRPAVTDKIDEIADSLKSIEIVLEIEERTPLDLTDVVDVETVAGLIEVVAAMSEKADDVCERCDEVKRERRSYSATTRETTVTLYCYGCENADLTRLARSVGK